MRSVLKQTRGTVFVCTEENNPSMLYHHEISHIRDHKTVNDYSADKIPTDQPVNVNAANLNSACARASMHAYSYPFKTCKI